MNKEGGQVSGFEIYFGSTVVELANGLCMLVGEGGKGIKPGLWIFMLKWIF